MRTLEHGDIMKFPEGELIFCWYCGYKFKSGNNPETIICPECGKTLKIFYNQKPTKK